MDWLTGSLAHFLLSGSVGCLVFLLILTISYAVPKIYHGRALLVGGRGYFILILACVLAFISAWYMHSFLDSFSAWWWSPLNTPLNIIK